MVEVLTHTIMFRHLHVSRPLACSKSTHFKFWTASWPAGPPRHERIVLTFSRLVSLGGGGEGIQAILGLGSQLTYVQYSTVHASSQPTGSPPLKGLSHEN